MGPDAYNGGKEVPAVHSVDECERQGRRRRTDFGFKSDWRQRKFKHKTLAGNVEGSKWEKQPPTQSQKVGRFITIRSASLRCS